MCQGAPSSNQNLQEHRVLCLWPNMVLYHTSLGKHISLELNVLLIRNKYMLVYKYM